MQFKIHVQCGQKKEASAHFYCTACNIAMRILSVCLSVARVYCDETKERSVQIFIPNVR